jgi:hypothetical protein
MSWHPESNMHLLTRETKSWLNYFLFGLGLERILNSLRFVREPFASKLSREEV